MEFNKANQTIYSAQFYVAKTHDHQPNFFSTLFLFIANIEMLTIINHNKANDPRQVSSYD